MKPTVWIGKNGVTKTLIEQVVAQLKANKIVKLKIQRPVAESESIQDFANKILKASNSSLINIRGRTFTIYKES
jgi:RNA-binding protein